MSTHKAIDRICVAAVTLSLVLTLLFVNGEALGLQPAGRAIGYENRLFDSSRVHTIEIVMEDWDGFLATCQSEEYSVCSVIIDGESYKNVGIRGKGNTSLSSVAAMGSSRYSFKIEFDQYDSTKSYHGLDKLSLNNLIQDNAMMKDYLAYQMMNAFGVPSPLCSFVSITVNGEDWGLYLAVEGVEEAFLQRNYGGDHGALYKPDSLSFGGGRGNGQGFDPGDFTGSPGKEGAPSPGQGERQSEEDPGPGQGGQQPDGGGGFAPPSSLPGSGAPEPAGETPPAGQQDTARQRPDASTGGMESGGGGGGFGGSADVKLQYIDDDPASYANIFDNAKAGLSEAGQARLITSLQALSSYENLEEVLDIDAVLRYFVVHNFVVNGDSYTGSMIHNYYLYEEDGRLSMIPWDYNLAFGTFAGGGATAAVNEAIDDALSDRPMQGWIFSDEAYTRRYHELYAEFLDTVNAAQIIEDAYALIAGYVEKDPTRFCSYEEFEAGVQALKEFCALRRESVQGQLAGTIPATSAGQNADPAALVNADGLELADMGTMNSGGGLGGFGGPGESAQGTFTPPGGGTGGGFTPPGSDTEGEATAQPEPEGGASPPASPENGSFTPPGGGMEGGFTPPGQQGVSDPGQSPALLLAVSVSVLALGLLAAFRYRR